MAARYLTIVPIPGAMPSDVGPGAAAAWFPVVGLAIGALLVVIDRLTSAVWTPLLAATLTVTVWKLITGGLHLDGLADCLDGLMGRDAAHRLAIMRDSRIGAFGAIGLVLLLLLVVAALSGIDASTRWRALIVAPVVGRAMPPVIGRVFSSVASGQGAGFRAELHAVAPFVTAGMALAVALAFLGGRGALACLVGAGVAVAFGAFMSRRLGGVSGDVHGAAVELTELAVLLTVAAAH